jgi:hypothetical protein
VSRHVAPHKITVQVTKVMPRNLCGNAPFRRSPS